MDPLASTRRALTASAALIVACAALIAQGPRPLQPRDAALPLSVWKALREAEQSGRRALVLVRPETAGACEQLGRCLHRLTKNLTKGSACPTSGLADGRAYPMTTLPGHRFRETAIDWQHAAARIKAATVCVTVPRRIATLLGARARDDALLLDRAGDRARRGHLALRDGRDRDLSTILKFVRAVESTIFVHAARDALSKLAPLAFHDTLRNVRVLATGSWLERGFARHRLEKLRGEPRKLLRYANALARVRGQLQLATQLDLVEKTDPTCGALHNLRLDWLFGVREPAFFSIGGIGLGYRFVDA